VRQVRHVLQVRREKFAEMLRELRSTLVAATRVSGVEGLAPGLRGPRCVDKAEARM
jgi:hypothetical protein